MFASLEYFNVGGQVGYGEDVLVNISTTALPTVNGAGQIFAHVASIALAYDSMQALEVDAESAVLSSLPMKVLGQMLPCTQAASFSSLSSSATVVAINRCNHTVQIQLSCNEDPALTYHMISYEAKLGDGSWAPLPPEGTSHPWSAPLHPTVIAVEATGSTLTLHLPALSLNVIERETATE